MTTSSSSLPSRGSSGGGVPDRASAISPRRAGLIVVLLAILLTIVTYILLVTLDYPAILLDKASFAASRIAQGGIAPLLGFVGLMLCGVLLIGVSLGLVPYLKGNRPISYLGSTTGALWVVSAVLGLVLVQLWGSTQASASQIPAIILLVLAQIASPLLLSFWTISISRQFQAHKVLGWVSTIGLLLLMLRSLTWLLNAILPIESGYFAAAGVLALLALPGESSWLFWLFLFGIHLTSWSNQTAVTTPLARTLPAGEGAPKALNRRNFLKFGTKLAVGLAGTAFVAASTGLIVVNSPTLEGDDVPSEPSLVGTLIYLIAWIDLKFVNPVHTIAQQLGMSQSRTPLPPGVVLEQVDAGGAPAQMIIPPGSINGRWLLYLHGGGFAQAGTDDNRAFVARLAQATGARALYPNYRLAPEHPFPAGLNDCVAAYRWLRSQGVSASQIAIAGESAGGNLTLATALALRDRGDDLPAALIAISAPTDMTMTGETYRTKAIVDPILGSGLPQDAFALYTDHGATDLRNPLVSPLYANVQGLPPTLLQVGTQEVLLSDSMHMAERLKAAGVEVKLEVWPGMYHAFTGGPTFIPEVQLATQHVVKFMRQHLH